MENDQQQWQQKELEEERYMSLLLLLDKAVHAARAGFFTHADIMEMQREFGLSPHTTH